MTRRPRRSEIRQRWIERANRMREWLDTSRRARDEQVARDNKVRALVPDGGGHGVTRRMRVISGEAAARKAVYVAKTTGPNRAARRDSRNRPRDARHWEPAPGPRWGGRDVWPTPRGQNVPYVRPADPGTGDRA